MYPPSPPSTDLSRSRLSALARWIRDDLDLLVAREGPDVLRPDDVLILHETFVALRLGTNITALDLRATGIHRAVQDIAGIATRWPSRLCDDCDKIIVQWTAKFGTFSELHPFLYGRGGRLAGIASVNAYSREALLKRWSETCPEKIDPKRSHRLGSLGFRAGDWWINTLFAHHAGIIGLEAVDGGTTFNAEGAYALTLKDSGELEANTSDFFTYRVPHIDRGKFRLTAATPRSRDPIRVLRSHNFNSIWGPKAGVRYEGLYTVQGWSIRQARIKDTVRGELKEGDIIFEIRFERKDRVPFDEVIRRPTATEVDDYVEYKRLRKLHGDGRRKLPGAIAQLLDADAQPVAKAAPPILPQHPFASFEESQETLKATSDTRFQPVFRRPHFDMPGQSTQDSDIVSPMTIPEASYFPLVPSKYNAVPQQSSLRSHPSRPQPSPHGSQRHKNPNPDSNTDSERTVTSTHAVIHAVAPWTALEPNLTLSITPSSTIRASPSTKRQKQNRQQHHTHRPRRKSSSFNTMLLHLRRPSSSPRQPNLHANISKPFDGTPETDDYFGPAEYLPQHPSTPLKCLPQDRDPVDHNSTSKPFNPLRTTRRGAISTNSGSEETLCACPDVFPRMPSLVLQHGIDMGVEMEMSAGLKMGMPLSLKRLMEVGEGGGEGEDSGVDVRVVFGEMVWGGRGRGREREASVHVAPEDVF